MTGKKDGRLGTRQRAADLGKGVVQCKLTAAGGQVGRGDRSRRKPPDRSFVWGGFGNGKRGVGAETGTEKMPRSAGPSFRRLWGTGEKKIIM